MMNSKPLKIKPIYPDQIRVHGLPFMLQGWNTILTKQETKDDDYPPCYKLKSYILYGLIPIIGITLYYDENKGWILFRNCDFQITIGINKTKSDNPCGTYNSDLGGDFTIDTDLTPSFLSPKTLGLAVAASVAGFLTYRLLF